MCCVRCGISDSTVDFVEKDNQLVCEACDEHEKAKEVLWQEYSKTVLQNGGDFDYSMNY